MQDVYDVQEIQYVQDAHDGRKVQQLTVQKSLSACLQNSKLKFLEFCWLLWEMTSELENDFTKILVDDAREQMQGQLLGGKKQGQKVIFKCKSPES